MVQWAELTGLYRQFSNLSSSESDLTLAINDVREPLGEIEAEVSDQP
jgi:hypothetical protein